MPIKIDMNNEQFQKDLFSLEKDVMAAVIGTLQKIAALGSWNELYKYPGLKWEKISSKHTSAGEPIYSIRFTQKCRGTALREGDFLRLLSIHPDHDSTYRS